MTWVLLVDLDHFFVLFFSFQFNHLILVLLGIRLYFFIFIFHKIIMILWLGLLISLFESSFFYPFFSWIFNFIIFILSWLKIRLHKLFCGLCFMRLSWSYDYSFKTWLDRSTRGWNRAGVKNPCDLIEPVKNLIATRRLFFLTKMMSFWFIYKKS
jgi:hypothetical protein